MTQIASVDHDARRIYLHVDTTNETIGYRPTDVHREYNALRQANANGEQNYAPLFNAEGYDALGGGRFTPRRGLIEVDGTRIVPFRFASHDLFIHGQTVSKGEELSDVKLFDLSDPAFATVQVNLLVVYTPTEIVEVATGAGLTIDDVRFAVFEYAIEQSTTYEVAMRRMFGPVLGENDGPTPGNAGTVRHYSPFSTPKQLRSSHDVDAEGYRVAPPSFDDTVP